MRTRNWIQQNFIDLAKHNTLVELQHFYYQNFPQFEQEHIDLALRNAVDARRIDNAAFLLTVFANPAAMSILACQTALHRAVIAGDVVCIRLISDAMSPKEWFREDNYYKTPLDYIPKLESFSALSGILIDVMNRITTEIDNSPNYIDRDLLYSMRKKISNLFPSHIEGGYQRMTETLLPVLRRDDNAHYPLKSTTFNIVSVLSSNNEQIRRVLQQPLVTTQLDEVDDPDNDMGDGDLRSSGHFSQPSNVIDDAELIAYPPSNNFN